MYGLTALATAFNFGSEDLAGLVIAAAFAAFADSFLPSRLVRKVTMRTVQVVAIGLIAVGAGMAAGFL